MSRLKLLVAAFLVFCFSGCASEEPVPKDRNAAKLPAMEDDWQVKRYTVEGLTPTEDEFLIDDGRIEVAPPKDWNRLARSDKYLVCFTRSDRTGLPRITVTAEPFASAVFTNVTTDNLVDFGKFRLEELTGGDEPEKLLETVRALQLGENFWIRYVRPASFRNAAAERQILETVHDGKIYRVELQVISGMLKEHRDAAYAVAAKMRFIDPNAAPPASDPPAADSPPPSQPPAESAP